MVRRLNEMRGSMSLSCVLVRLCVRVCARMRICVRALEVINVEGIHTGTETYAAGDATCCAVGAPPPAGETPLRNTCHHRLSGWQGQVRSQSPRNGGPENQLPS